MSNYKTLIVSDETRARWTGIMPESLFVVPGRANGKTMNLLQAVDGARRSQKPVVVITKDHERYQWYVHACGVDPRRMRYVGDDGHKLRAMREPVVIRMGDYWYRSDVYELDRLLAERQAWVFYDNCPRQVTGRNENESLNSEG